MKGRSFLDYHVYIIIIQMCEAIKQVLRRESWRGHIVAIHIKSDKS